ncbi:MAG TPA: CorA family divalent cation transporter [Gaiella sp.]
MAVDWADLVDPTREELLTALPSFVDPEDIEILAAPPAARGRETRPLVESHGAYAIAIFLLPRAYPEDDRVEYLELDVVATPRRIVTVRKTGPDGALAQVDAIETRLGEAAGAGELVHALSDEVADSFLDLLDALYGEIDELEGHVDELAGTVVRRRLAELRHELLQARRTASATRAMMRRVIDGRVDVGGELFPPDVERRFVDTYETLVRVAEELDVARDLLASVRDYLQAKITETQNDVGKKLTVIASLVLVPSFIVGFYGQNFEGVFHRTYWTLGFSVGSIVVVTLVQLALFRWRRWI